MQVVAAWLTADGATGAWLADPRPAARAGAAPATTTATITLSNPRTTLYLVMAGLLRRRREVLSRIAPVAVHAI
jgi:hypothetical protein